MSEKPRRITFQPECDKTEIWADDESIFISQEVPLLQETNLIIINRAFLPKFKAAIADLVGKK